MHTTTSTKVPAVRSAFRMSDREVRVSARLRLEELARRYGDDSPEVHRAMARWGAIDRSRTGAADVRTVIEALDSDMTAILDVVSGAGR